MNESQFCPNCGQKVDAKAEFCPNCGKQLKVKAANQAHRTKNVRATNSQPVVTQQQATVAKKRPPMKQKSKIILSSLAALVVVFVIFYAWGSNHYQRNNQLAQINAALKNPRQSLSQYVTSDNPNVHVTDAALKPTQKYYAENYEKANKMADDLKYSDQSDDVSLVRSGHYFLFFPKYKLQFKTYTPQIKTNHANSSIYVNGQKFGGIDGSGGEYYKKITPLFPGKYHIVVKSIASGHELSADKSMLIDSNQAINMDIKTVNFMVKSMPGAAVYINDKKVGILNRRGAKNFKEYPATADMKIYVEATIAGKTIKSKMVNYDDLGFDDDDDSSSNVIKPEWPGLISQDDAESILQDNFNSPDEDAFIGGAENKGYQDLHTQEAKFRNSDEIIDFSMECSIVSIAPAPNNCSSVTYKITYTFEHDDYEHKQVLLYSGGLFHQVGDEDDGKQKIKSIGNGKVISDKKYDN
ncbi:zinc ribbon domain-containing protein [Lactobacillus xylocopicola]|uniref:Zinc-ribbon domain-containing protein n=1 Tax=Lactobacillus xylocopicola TaxID=2976676 RepID=A0ABN6SIU6_9LACO|nr:zinc-ribbon domain-containing protein [Lactobacillus xylocopicola]BDR60034.1 hypothetical protein KIM322_02950 [Lactobacillus xylocopicola]